MARLRCRIVVQLESGAEQTIGEVSLRPGESFVLSDKTVPRNAVRWFLSGPPDAKALHHGQEEINCSGLTKATYPEDVRSGMMRRSWPGIACGYTSEEHHWSIMRSF